MSYKPTIITDTANPVERLGPTIVGERSTAPHPLQVKEANFETPSRNYHVTAVSGTQGVLAASTAVQRPELESRFGHDNALVDAVMQLLSNFSPATMTQQDCDAIGVGLQEAYAHHVDAILRLSESEKISESKRHIGRLFEILQEVADKFGQRLWVRIGLHSASDVLHESQNEIKELRYQLNHCRDGLNGVRQRLLDSGEQIESLRFKTQAHICATEVLADFVADYNKRALLDRALSLGNTVTQIEQQRVLLDNLNSRISTLATTINDAVLVHLPAWITQVSALPKGDFNETQRFVIKECALKIINCLK